MSPPPAPVCVVVLATALMACSDAASDPDAPGAGADVPRESASAPSGPGTGVAGGSGTEVAIFGDGPLAALPDAGAERGGEGALADALRAEARRRAGEPWADPSAPLPAELAELSYVDYRGIAFDEEATIWRGDTPFELQLFHPGGGFDVPVRIHLVEGGRIRELDFDPARFRYGDEVRELDVDGLPEGLGHPGFRILHPLNEAGRRDEVVSFLGASYFRLLGPGHGYGLSTRGVAVNTAGEGGEEFPDFVAFWIEKPAPGADRLRLHALLDGPSVTGAFHFTLTPGASADGGFGVERSRPTVVEVEASLFARGELPDLGVAPLTSMYLHGTFGEGIDDVRPRVHDSEGLLMHTGAGEWIWRPLTNRGGVRTTTLFDGDPRGFGLVQRTRDFDDYLDLEARYERRPSEWVEIDGGDWGRGGVRLVELPTPSEFEDNVVAFWAPERALAAGDSAVFRYRLVTFDDRLESRDDLPGGPIRGESLARVVRTRVARDGLPGEVERAPDSRRRVVLDFAGGELAEARGTPVADASTSAGTIEDLRVEELPDGGRRVTFAIDLAEDRRADLRVLLRNGDDGRALTESWSYLLEWTP